MSQRLDRHALFSVREVVKSDTCSLDSLIKGLLVPCKVTSPWYFYTSAQIINDLGFNNYVRGGIVQNCEALERKPNHNTE